MSKYRELLPDTNLKELLMVFLPIIANNLGKVAVAAATTLGIVGYVNRERISRWFADESEQRNQGRTQDATGVLEAAESLKNLHGQLSPGELDKKHAELLDKLALNTTAVTEFKGLIKDVHEELGSMAENFQGELDAQYRTSSDASSSMHFTRRVQTRM